MVDSVGTAKKAQDFAGVEKMRILERYDEIRCICSLFAGDGASVL